MFLTKLCENNNITFDNLCNELGLNWTIMNAWDQGYRSFTEGNFFWKVAERFNLDPVKFTNFNESRPFIKDKEKYDLDFINNLNEDNFD